MRLRTILSFWLFLCLGAMPWMPSASAQSVEILTDDMESVVSSLRELPFLHDVNTTSQTPEELQQVLQREITRAYPGNTLSVLEKRLFKFGFVASPINLRETLNRLLSQQIAGYYDPHQKKNWYNPP